MNTNVILTEPMIIVHNSVIESSSIFTDPIFYISLITLIFAAFGVYFSIKIFRPKVHIEIKNVLCKESLRSYELVVSNNGNVMAEDIKIEFSDDLEQVLNNECYSKDEDGFGSFKFIKQTLNKEIKYLPSGKEVKGLFITVENEDNNDSPLLFNKEFTIYITYKNSITGLVYPRQSVKLKLTVSDWFTSYHMTDNLGYDLGRIIKNLSNLNNSSSMILKNQGKILKSTEHVKLHNATNAFNSLSKAEIITILKILGKKGSKEEAFFQNKLQEYVKIKNDKLSKKIRKLKLDEYKFFMKNAQDFRDNGL